MLQPGYTFLAQEPKSPVNHLYVIIAIVGAQALFVNITSDNGRHEKCCLLQKGEHPFIKHDSVINYGDAKMAPLDKIEDAIQKRIFTPSDPMPSEILKKIQSRAHKSESFPQKFLVHLLP